MQQSRHVHDLIQQFKRTDKIGVEPYNRDPLPLIVSSANESDRAVVGSSSVNNQRGYVYSYNETIVMGYVRVRCWIIILI